METFNGKIESNEGVKKVELSVPEWNHALELLETAIQESTSDEAEESAKQLLEKIKRQIN